MDPTAAGLQWLRIIWLGFLRRRCPRAQQPLLCSQGSHEHPMKCSNTRVHQEWCFKFVIFPFSPPLNFWCGNTLDTQSLSTLHMCNGNVLSIQSGSTTMIWFTLPDSFQKLFQFLDVLASLKTMFKLKKLMFSTFCSLLQTSTDFYRLLLTFTDFYRLLKTSTDF